MARRSLSGSFDRFSVEETAKYIVLLVLYKKVNMNNNMKSNININNMNMDRNKNMNVDEEVCCYLLVIS